MLYGAHVSSAGGIDTAIDRAEAIGANAVQVFTQSPRVWRATAHTPEAVQRFRRRRKQARVKAVVCHATYLINLAATDDTTYARSVRALSQTVEAAHLIGADGVIFHVGSHLGRGLDAALHQIVPALQVVCGERREDGPWLLLENSAGHQGTIGVTLAELERILDELGRPQRVGLCLDTCHLFASGIEIRTTEAVDALVDEVDSRFGLERLRCLHVNDSKLPFASQRDRHANLGEGAIGDGMAAILGCPRLQGLPAVMETPGPDGHGVDATQMAELRRLHRNGRRRWARRRTHSM